VNDGIKENSQGHIAQDLYLAHHEVERTIEHLITSHTKPYQQVQMVRWQKYENNGQQRTDR
jgi:hypothetical protein